MVLGADGKPFILGVSALGGGAQSETTDDPALTDDSAAGEGVPPIPATSSDATDRVIASRYRARGDQAALTGDQPAATGVLGNSEGGPVKTDAPGRPQWIYPVGIPSGVAFGGVVAPSDAASDGAQFAVQAAIADSEALPEASVAGVAALDVHGFPTAAYLAETTWIIAGGSTRDVAARIEDVRRIMYRLAWDSDCTEYAKDAFRAAEGNLALALKHLDRDEISAPATKSWLRSVYGATIGIVRIASPLLGSEAAIAIQTAAVVLDELVKRKWPE